MVVVVVEAALPSDPPPESLNETSTTPAPMAKIARPMNSICEDRRIAMGSPSGRRASPRDGEVLAARARRASFDFFVGGVRGMPDSPGGPFAADERTSAGYECGHIDRRRRAGSSPETAAGGRVPARVGSPGGGRSGGHPAAADRAR